MQFSQCAIVIYSVVFVVVSDGEEEEEEGGRRSEQNEFTTKFLSGSGFKLLLTLHSGHTTISGAEETNKEPPEWNLFAAAEVDAKDTAAVVFMHFQQNVCAQLGSILASLNTSIHTEQQQLSKYFENNDISSVLFRFVEVVEEGVVFEKRGCVIIWYLEL
jgi:hypothetical protein